MFLVPKHTSISHTPLLPLWIPKAYMTLLPAPKGVWDFIGHMPGVPVRNGADKEPSWEDKVSSCSPSSTIKQRHPLLSDIRKQSLVMFTA